MSYGLPVDRGCLIPLVLGGEIPAVTTNPINVIDVRDVASVAVAAAERGPFGEPISLLGHNTTQDGLMAWGANFGITITFPIMLATIGLGGAYGFYTVCAVISIVFVVKMVHETRGIELEDMQG